MKRTVLLAASSLGAAAFAHADTQAYDLDGFTGVKAERAIDIIFTQGDAFSVVAEEEDGDFEGLEVYVDDGVLIATRPRGLWQNSSIRINYRNGERVVRLNGDVVPAYTVRVTAPSLSSAAAASSGRVDAGDLSSGALSLRASSSGDVVAAGSCASLTIEASSSGDVDASALACGAVEADAGSSGDVRLAAAGGSVEIEAASSADVIMTGSCDDLTVVASSSSDVKGRNMVCADATITASSSADVTVQLTGTLDATASSSADINVYGSPTISSVEESSSGDVNMKSG